jgi:hypothetical protein
MAAVVKQDSNFTNLSYAVEQSPGVLPGSPVWFTLEPNSYSTFGANVKTKQRMPINTSRQLKKAVVVDLDAAGAWVQDLTPANFQDLGQCFMFALLRTKNEIPVAATTGNNTFAPVAGGGGFVAGDLVFAKGFDAGHLVDNGLFTVTGLPSLTAITVTPTTLTASSVQTAILSRVGFQFNATDVSLTQGGGAYPTLNVTSVAALGTLTSSGVFANSDTVVIGGISYLMQTVLTTGAYHVAIGGTATISLANLANAINFTGGGVPGTDYDNTATIANPYVTATSTATTLVVTAIASGLVGNAITTTKVSANNAWGGAVLATGSGGRGFNSFGLIVGEFIFIGSDEVNTSFATAADNGFCRVRAITQNVLTLDKTQFTMVTDAGTGKTLRIYFGRVLKNESLAANQVTRSIQIERSLGFPDSSFPTQIQGEYLPNSLANTLKIDLKTADIVRMELDFLSNTSTQVTGAQGLKTGARPALVSTDAFNTTSDVHYSKMAVVTSNVSAPTALFAFISDLVIDLKNNVRQNKAIAVLGAFSATAGFFQVSAALTAYFQNVTEIQAVIANNSLTVETHMVKFQQGVTIDLPLVVLAKAMADVKINEPIKIPLAADASTAASIDPNLDYSMLFVFWDYLPLAA